MKIKRVIEIEKKDLERIREIVERENKTALSVTTRGTAYITIADSKPYEERPQGGADVQNTAKPTKEVIDKLGECKCNTCKHNGTWACNNCHCFDKYEGVRNE